MASMVLLTASAVAIAMPPCRPDIGVSQVDGGNRRVDLEHLGDSHTTLWADLVVPQIVIDDRPVGFERLCNRDAASWPSLFPLKLTEMGIGQK